MAAFRYSAGSPTTGIKLPKSAAGGYGNTWKAICAVSGTQTVVDTGISIDTVNSKLFDIAWVADSHFNFYIDVNLVAQITVHIPAASDRFGFFACSDNKNTGTAVGFTWHHAFITLK